MDLRRQKSQSKLKKAMVALLEQKDLEKITIEEVTRAAGVTRPTFYANYPDVQTLTRACIDDLVVDLKDAFMRFEDDAKSVPVERLANFFTHLLETLETERRLWQIAMSGRAGGSALQAIQSSTATLIQLRATRALHTMDANELHLISVFYASATISVVSEYLKGYFPMEKKILGAAMAKLVVRGVGQELGDLR